MVSNIPNIGAPAGRALAGVGVRKLEDLVKFSEKELLELHGFGPKALRILKEVMDEHGLKFRKEVS